MCAILRAKKERDFLPTDKIELHAWTFANEKCNFFIKFLANMQLCVKVYQ